MCIHELYNNKKYYNCNHSFADLTDNGIESIGFALKKMTLL